MPTLWSNGDTLQFINVPPANLDLSTSQVLLNSSNDYFQFGPNFPFKSERFYEISFWLKVNNDATSWNTILEIIDVNLFICLLFERNCSAGSK